MTSFPVPPAASVMLGIGRTVKRDAVVVKVVTEGGLTGYGETGSRLTRPPRRPRTG